MLDKGSTVLPDLGGLVSFLYRLNAFPPSKPGKQKNHRKIKSIQQNKTLIILTTQIHTKYTMKRLTTDDVNVYDVQKIRLSYFRFTSF